MKDKEEKYSFYRKIVSLIDSTVDFTVLIFFLIVMLFCAYSLWDNNHIYSKATPSVYETYKPTHEDTKSFEQLVSINPDVYGWITIYGTKIDYPLLQGEDNDKYINTDAEGNFSLSGSLFLNCRNVRDMSDTVNIIYGHHMEKEAMLGGLDNYKDLDYFKSHRYGNLFVEGKEYGVDFFSLLSVDAYDTRTYNTSETDIESYLEYIKSVSISSLEISSPTRLVLLSTCASDSTNGRLVLVGSITDEIYEDPYQEKEEEEEAYVDYSFIIGLLSIVICVLVFFILLVLLVRRNKKKKHK